MRLNNKKRLFVEENDGDIMTAANNLLFSISVENQ